MVMNEGLGRIIDIYRLRESFNAAAQYDDRATVEKLLDATRRFENIMTYYYHEYPTMPENKRVLKMAEAQLSEIADLAFALKAEAMILPVPAESYDAPLVGNMVRNLEPAIQFHLPLR
jgi:hypothetical protein